MPAPAPSPRSRMRRRSSAIPSPAAATTMPDLAGAIALNALAQRENGHGTVEIPTGVGFCMYLRHDCLAATGGLRGDIFAQGYGEENDFCLRARHLGFTANGGARRLCRACGRRFVPCRGPGADRAQCRASSTGSIPVITSWSCASSRRTRCAPPARAWMRPACSRDGAQTSRAADLASHGGGVARQVAAQMAELRRAKHPPAAADHAIPGRPEDRRPTPGRRCSCEGDAADYPNLAFTLPGRPAGPAAPAARPADRQKSSCIICSAIIPPSAAWPNPSTIPQDVIVHDYASFCPRVNLLNRPDAAAPPRYCGEPEANPAPPAASASRREIYDPLPVPKLLRPLRRRIRRRGRVIVPSADAARRLARHFPGVQPLVMPVGGRQRPPDGAPAARLGGARICRDRRHRPGERV